jgi:8-amino-7-oxononanoate synthase
MGALQALVGKSGGRVIVDDSLAFGVLGRRSADSTFGDGTGTARWLGLDHGGLLWLGSRAPTAHPSP